MDKEKLLEGLSPEQREKLQNAKSSEEIIKLAEEEDIDLTDEQLKAINGGGCIFKLGCPKCHSEDVDSTGQARVEFGKTYRPMKCNGCGYTWKVRI